MTEFRRVTNAFYVAPQISVYDVDRAADAGIKTMILNRPDRETSDQPDTQDIISAADARGIAFHHVPITAPPQISDVEAMEKAIAAAGTDPILAFCRSGTRSITLWAYVQAKGGKMPVDAILQTAREAGYDLSGHGRALETLFTAAQ